MTNVTINCPYCKKEQVIVATVCGFDIIGVDIHLKCKHCKKLLSLVTRKTNDHLAEFEIKKSDIDYIG